MTATIITVKVVDGHIVDWMDTQLLSPTAHRSVKSYSADYWNNKSGRCSYELEYSIDGYFSTAKGKRYLHDIAARIAYQVKGTYTVEEAACTVGKYELSDFSHLDRVPSFNARLEANALNGSRDEIFDALRHKAYQMFKSNTLNLEALTVYGNRISNSSQHIKYLAPNVFKWVEKNYTGRQSTMSRSEAAINASKIKSRRVEERIFCMLESPFFQHEALSLRTISKKLSLHRDTVKKYLNKWNFKQRAYKVLRESQTPYVQLVCTTIQEVLKSGLSVKGWYQTDITEQGVGAVQVANVGSSPPNTA